MPKVILYSTPTCLYCMTIKEFFKEREIAFETIDVSKDDEAREKMINGSGQMGVPVVEIDGDMIIGFNKAKISKLLNIKK